MEGRQERILARRKLRQERAKALREGEGQCTFCLGHLPTDQAAKASVIAPESTEREIGKGRMNEGKERVKRLKVCSSRRRPTVMQAEEEENVTAVRIKSDVDENQRRLKEHESRMRRQEEHKGNEQKTAQEMAAIQMRWDAMKEHEAPQILHAAIEQQRIACDEVIKRKDFLINKCKAARTEKDTEFVKALKTQKDAVEKLVKEMGAAIEHLRQGFDEELRGSEAAFDQELAEMIEKNHLEVDAMQSKRRAMEVAFTQQAATRRENQANQLQEIRQGDGEEFALLKIKLESEIQTLEQQLQEMRATYQLNTEKLEYNFRVLTERDAENSHIINRQKRKIARLQDVLSGITAKYNKQDKDYRQRNLELTEDYKRITEQFKDLQSKFRHFRAADGKKYREVWKMNEEAVMEYVEKVLKADKIIHEQQLGLHWFPPTGDLCQSAHAKGDTVGSRSEAAEPVAPRGSSSLAQQATGDTVKRVLELLCNEAGFLVEEKVRHVLDALEKDERNLLEVDSIFAALSVETEEDIERLMGYFLKEGARGGEQGPMLIDSNEAVAALRRFVDEQQSLPQKGPGHRQRMTSEERQELNRREEREFWERLAGVLAPKTVTAWDSLERSFLDYNKLLTARSTMLEENQALAQQNEELSIMLQGIQAGKGASQAPKATGAVERHAYRPR